MGGGGAIAPLASPGYATDSIRYFHSQVSLDWKLRVICVVFLQR